MASPGKYQIGKLYKGMPEDSVVVLIGKPDSLGAGMISGRTGSFIKETFYKKIGLYIVYQSEDSTSSLKKILTLTAEAPCTLSVEKGVKIGTDYADIISRYCKMVDSTTSSWGKQIVVGSIYGGMIFTFEKNKVKRIFIGAAAD
jgi:hypothetical protein